MGDAGGFLLSMIFGVIGMGYMMYGKRTTRIVPLAAGMMLCVFPYFITNFYAMVVVGVALSVGPFFYRDEE